MMPATVRCGAYAELRGEDGGFLPIGCDREPGHDGPHGWVFTIVGTGYAQQVEWDENGSTEAVQ